MHAIFISYRREDAEGQAGRLFDDLVTQFGEDSVFMDVSGIEPGRDFRRAIDEQVASCGVLLAVIGKSWFDAKDESGRSRLDDPMDFVRLETASALKRDIPVIPVLVRGASMPRPEQLPPDLAELAYRNAVELTHARWDSDVQVLIKALRPHVELQQKEVDTAKTETEAGVRPLGEPGVAGTAPVADTQSAKKSLRSIVVTSIAVIAVAVGGYIVYEKATEKAKTTRIAEAEKVSGEKATEASVPAKETGSDAKPNAEATPSPPPQSTDSVQAGWRFCHKCNSLFFDGYPSKGVCTAGEAHVAKGYNFVLPHDISSTGQADWRFCRKCNTMFFDGYHTKGVCPARPPGAHEADGYNFVLPRWRGPGQAGWFRCQKCQSLFFNYSGTGVCPVGGGHEKEGVNLVLPHE